MNLEERSIALKSSFLGWGMVFLFVALNILGAMLLKNQIQKLGNLNFVSVRTSFIFILKMFSAPQTLLAIGSLFSSTVAWTIALANLELSRAYPVAIGLHFLAVMTSAIFLYSEALTLAKIFGITLILSGVLFILK